LSGLRQVASASALTEREVEILDQLVAGHSNKEIAQRLDLPGRALEVHLCWIYAKLGVRSRLEAVTHTVSRERQSRIVRPYRQILLEARESA
jgi:DNA-binding CsgD family transcriptional regulator